MPISELGYRSWEGKRVSWLWRWLAITRTHVGIAYRDSKLLRRFLVVAWMPLLYFAPVFFAVGYVADPSNDLDGGGVLTEIGTEIIPRELLDLLRSQTDTVLPAVWAFAFYVFFSIVQSALSMIVVAIVVPPLIARDVRSKAFLLYFSKPISGAEYLVGKLGVPLFFVFVITLLPAIVLYVISMALCPSFDAAFATLPILLRIVLASLTIGVPVSLVALLLSSLTREHRIAMFAWMAIWIFGEISYRLIAFDGGNSDVPRATWAFLASIRETTVRVTARIFDVQGHLDGILELLSVESVDGGRTMRAFADLVQTGDTGVFGVPESTVATVALATLSFVCAVIVMRRVTKPVRI